MSTSAIRAALPELKAAYDQLDAYARTNGIGIDIADFGGVRTLADTTKILGYRQDDFDAAVRAGTIRPDTTLQQFRPIAPFGLSYHNYGAAFDVRIAARPANMSVDGALRILGAYAPKIGLRWGGQFSNPDIPHFELAIPLATAQQRYRDFVNASNADNSFSLEAFLPGLTPSSDELEPTIDAPDVGDYMAADDSGVAALDVPDDPTPTYVVLGLVVAGVVAWALRRKFF